MGLWQPEGLGWISWQRRFFSGVGTQIVSQTGCCCTSIPSQGTQGPVGLSHLLHDLSPNQELHSCQDPTLPVPDPGSDQHHSRAKVLPLSLAPSPSSAGTQCSASCWCQHLQPKSAFFSWKGGTFQGFVEETNTWKWMFNPGDVSTTAQHLQVVTSATFPGRGVSRQEFPAEFPPLQLW